MKTSTNGLNFISNWEGCVLKVYNDIAGKATIGIGHLILPGENFTTITKDEALQILAKDVGKCEAAISKYITVELNQNQFDALVSFSFNCGVGALNNTGVAKAVNAGNFDLVPAKLLEWCKYSVIENGVKVTKTNNGLYNRRKSEGELFSTPIVTAPVNDGNGLLSQSEIDQVNALVQQTVWNTLDGQYDDFKTIESEGDLNS